MADFVWKQRGRYWNSRGTNELDATPSAPDCQSCVDPVAYTGDDCGCEKKFPGVMRVTFDRPFEQSTDELASSTQILTEAQPYAPAPGGVLETQSIATTVAVWTSLNGLEEVTVTKQFLDGATSPPCRREILFGNAWWRRADFFSGRLITQQFTPCWTLAGGDYVYELAQSPVVRQVPGAGYVSDNPFGGQCTPPWACAQVQNPNRAVLDIDVSYMQFQIQAACTVVVGYSQVSSNLPSCRPSGLVSPFWSSPLSDQYVPIPREGGLYTYRTTSDFCGERVVELPLFSRSPIILGAVNHAGQIPNKVFVHRW